MKAVAEGDKAAAPGAAPPITRVQAAGTGKRSTVGTRFAADLSALVKLLESVSARFIRCIKPNMLKAPDAFDGGAVLRQLRYTGTSTPLCCMVPDLYGPNQLASFAQPPQARSSA